MGTESVKGLKSWRFPEIDSNFDGTVTETEIQGAENRLDQFRAVKKIGEYNNLRNGLERLQCMVGRDVGRMDQYVPFNKRELKRIISGSETDFFGSILECGATRPTLALRQKAKERQNKERNQPLQFGLPPDTGAKTTPSAEDARLGEELRAMNDAVTKPRPSPQEVLLSRYVKGRKWQFAAIYEQFVRRLQIEERGPDMKGGLLVAHLVVEDNDIVDIRYDKDASSLQLDIAREADTEFLESFKNIFLALDPRLLIGNGLTVQYSWHQAS